MIRRPEFPTTLSAILARMNEIDPIAYGRTRNYTDGAVTLLSPYLSRGVISTRNVLDSLIARGFSFGETEQLVKELAWRDYFQRVWQVRDISADLRDSGPVFEKRGVVPSSLMSASTGIRSIDEAVRVLMETGYMHNHCRMYVAAIACHTARCHWLEPARWMYHHLIDGDWASNACSWQWVAGTGSSKPWVANQENINRFTGSDQSGTFLDVPYEYLLTSPVPEVLRKAGPMEAGTTLPGSPVPAIDPSRPVHLYNYYQLDPQWRAEEDCNRILLLEPEMFNRYPVGRRALDFMFSLASNIPELRVFTGSFTQLNALVPGAPIRYKEHPLNRHYIGQSDARDWLVPEVEGFFPSFSGYWKRIEPFLSARFRQDKT